MENSIFKHRSGRCPYCDSESIHVVEGEVIDYKINESGIPQKIISRDYKLAGYCTNCNKPIFIEPIDGGMGGYIAHPWNEIYINFVQNINNITKSISKPKSINNTCNNIDNDLFFGDKEGEVLYGEEAINLLENSEKTVF